MANEHDRDRDPTPQEAQRNGQSAILRTIHREYFNPVRIQTRWYDDRGAAYDLLQPRIPAATRDVYRDAIDAALKRRTPLHFSVRAWRELWLAALAPFGLWIIGPSTGNRIRMITLEPQLGRVLDKSSAQRAGEDHERNCRAVGINRHIGNSDCALDAQTNCGLINFATATATGICFIADRARASFS
jgi:hypothetical protein